MLKTEDKKNLKTYQREKKKDTFRGTRLSLTFQQKPPQAVVLEVLWERCRLRILYPAEVFLTGQGCVGT